jgi:ribulose kinase
MDARSATQAREIMDVARSHVGGGGGGEDADDVLSAFPELRVNSAGAGPISAEWLLPKAMWMKQNEPRVWEGADVICEYQDYINHRLTGRMVASGCNAAARWHHDGWEAVRGDDDGGDGGDDGGDDGSSRGRPMGLYRALGMEDLAEKLPKVTLAMGDVVGGLADSASRDLGLPPGTPVVQGGPDAFVGMIGLGVVRPGMTCLITGSSHLHCLVTPRGDSSSPGTWGAYRGAPLPHLNFAEGGQSSTGSLVRWARDLFSSSDNDGVGEGGGGMISYKVLDDEASAVPPGCDGLVALETW